MTFFWPNMLWLLLLVPAIVLAYVLLMRRKKRTAVRYASLSVVKEALGKGPGIKRHIPAALLLLALTVVIIATSRPAVDMTLPSQSGTILLAMDVSLSMQADDVEPDRIRASQEAVREFIANQPRHVKVGVVTFDGRSMLVQQPTTNREEVISAVNRFRLGRGTNVGGAIVESLTTLFPESHFDLGRQQFWSGRRPPAAPLGAATEEEDTFSPVEPGSYTNAVVVLLTDGRATTGPNPIDAARLAADRGVRIFTVGFGQRGSDLSGYGGMSIYFQLDEETLNQVAEITRGKYYQASSASELTEVYDTLASQLEMETEKTEITSFLSGLSALLLLVSAGLSMMWFNRFT